MTTGAMKTTRATTSLTNRVVHSKTMIVVEHSDGWWTVEIPDTVNECGPYKIKQDAEDDMHGMARFFWDEGDPMFILGK